MRISLIIALFLFSLQSVAQESVMWEISDTISGGKYVMALDPAIKNMVVGKEKSVCAKPTYVPPKKLSPADKCATQQKIMGYKIQIFYTKDRDAANKVKNDFSKQFPNLTPELIYASPDYRIIVGDYFTRASAGPDLRRIQKTYKGAFTVQWRVWCRKAI